MTTPDPARHAAERIVAEFHEMNRLLPLAGGIPRPIEESTDHAVVLARTYLAEHLADDDDTADVNWLMDDHGFAFSPDGTALVKKLLCHWEVICGVKEHRGESEVSSASLHFTYPGPPKIGGVFAIEDNPTRGSIRRLLTALGSTP